ncbi:hypothetical protein BDR04DRAFT_1101888, partial [Suillus decipiens]
MLLYSTCTASFVTQCIALALGHRRCRGGAYAAAARRHTGGKHKVGEFHTGARHQTSALPVRNYDRINQATIVPLGPHKYAKSLSLFQPLMPVEHPTESADNS